MITVSKIKMLSQQNWAFLEFSCDVSSVLIIILSVILVFITIRVHENYLHVFHWLDRWDHNNRSFVQCYVTLSKYWHGNVNDFTTTTIVIRNSISEILTYVRLKFRIVNLINNLSSEPFILPKEILWNKNGLILSQIKVPS